MSQEDLNCAHSVNSVLLKWELLHLLITIVLSAWISQFTELRSLKSIIIVFSYLCFYELVLISIFFDILYVPGPVFINLIVWCPNSMRHTNYANHVCWGSYMTISTLYHTSLSVLIKLRVLGRSLWKKSFETTTSIVVHSRLSFNITETWILPNYKGN